MRIVLGLLLALGFAGSALPLRADDALRERAIAAIRAIEERDAERLAAEIDKDFVAVGARGDIRTRDAFLAAMRDWPFEKRPAPPRIWRDVQTFEGDKAASFVARSQTVAPEGDPRRASYSTLYALRWTRAEDRWLLSGYQTVRMPALPEIVTIPNGAVTLQAMVFRPQGNGPFPAVVYAHGNEPDPSFLFERVGPAIAARGYYVIGVHRRGSGLSAGEAPNLLAQLTEIEKREGIAARSRAAIADLEGPQLDDIVAAVGMAASHPEIDAGRVFLVGNSFGGVLAMLAAERDLGLKGAANFAGSAMNWERSELFRQRMLTAARNARIPVFLGQAENDFSTLPTSELAQELSRSGKAHRARIFPAFGITPVDGHSFGIDGVDLWFDEVMGFLDSEAGAPAPRGSAYAAPDELDWQDTHTYGFPEGRTRALLHRNADGGGAALWRLPKGYVEPRHVHRNGDHRIYVLKGAMTYGDRPVAAGHFIDTPAGQPHGPITALEDTEFLIWADHSLDLEILP